MIRLFFLLMFCCGVQILPAQSAEIQAATQFMQQQVVTFYQLQAEQRSGFGVILKRYQRSLLEIDSLRANPALYWRKRQTICEGLENSLDRLLTNDQRQRMRELERARRQFRANAREKGQSEFLIRRQLFDAYPGKWYQTYRNK